MPRFYETTLSITNLHNLSISTHVNRSRIILSNRTFINFEIIISLFTHRAFSFCTVTCSDLFPVTPHIRYSSPALIFFANLLDGPNRKYRYANRVRI